MGRLLDYIKQNIYEHVTGKAETHLKCFDMQNAWKFFIDMAHEHPEIKRCGLSIEKKKSLYQITQLMVDENGDMLMDGKDFCIGRVIQAEQLDDSVIEFMAGNTIKSMDLPY